MVVGWDGDYRTSSINRSRLPAFKQLQSLFHHEELNYPASAQTLVGEFPKKFNSFCKNSKMTDTAVEFLLEYLMQLINGDNKLILKAYDEKFIEKDQIEWLYKEMQLLRKFLKDTEEYRSEHEKLKDLVVKIRDVTYHVEDVIDFILISVTYHVEDTIDWFILRDTVILSSEFCSLYPAYGGTEKKYDGWKDLIEDTNFIETEVKILCIIQTYLASRVRRSFDKVIDKEIKSIKTKVMKIFENGLSDAWFDGSYMDHKFHRFFILSEEMFNWSEKIFKEMSLTWPELHNDDDLCTLFNFSKEMARLAKEVHLHFHFVIEEIKSIKTEVMKIYEKGMSNITWLHSCLADEFLLLSSLSQEMIILVAKIPDGLDSVIKEINSMKKEISMRWLVSGFRLRTGNRIHNVFFESVIEENKSIGTKVMEIFGNRLSDTRIDCNMDQKFYLLSEEMVNRSEKFFERLSPTWPKHHIVDEGLRSLITLSKDISNLAKEIHFGFCFVMEEIKSIKTEVMKVYVLFDVTKIDHRMTSEFCLFFNSSQKMVNLVEQISHGFDGVMEENNSKKMEIPITCLPLSGFGFIEEIKSIKTEVMGVYDEMMYGIGVPQTGRSSHVASSRTTSPIIEEEIIVGFDDDTMTILDLLTEEHEKQLKVIPIIGMPGLGKTTLAKKVYNDPFIVYHFYIRAWTHVSQIYQKRDLLLDILCSAFQFRDETCNMSNEKLGEELYKHLKGKRYLIVMDDVWTIGAWDGLKRYFPNDNNGSRVMFTSRLADVAMALDAEPHYLRFLSEHESWNLLRQKIFRNESCPLELMETGKQIAKKCRGLPLAIVVVSGLLAKKDRTQDWWSKVAESVSSYIVSDLEQYMNTLALSYHHLPHHLKACFLYFGAFPKDYEIRVRKLIWLWIAEGFIHRIGQKSLEDVAENYLIDLIDRSLVLVAKRRSCGGIRTCRVHDLLHDLCLRKAKEENFLQQIYMYEEILSSSPIVNKQLFLCNHPSSSSSSFSSSSVTTIEIEQRRLSVHSRIFRYISSKPFVIPQIRSFLYFVSEQNPSPAKDMSFIDQAFKILRVLDLSTINISYFPNLILQLVFLRYLALQGKHLSLPINISNLWNLETLILKQGSGALIPPMVWRMVKLRHLCIGGENYIAATPPTLFGYPTLLDNLQTISQVEPSVFCEDILARTPNLRKLVFCGRFKSDDGCLWFPDLDLLNHLETLTLLNRYVPNYHLYNLQRVKFPPNVRKLILSNTALEWKEMSILGMLPNLEVLKLEFQACIGPRWDTSDDGFRRLKFLKFHYMNIEQWNASRNHFPSLQHLVLHRCRKLKEIPSELGHISTLQMIEVSWCSDSAIKSARQIQEEQKSEGNDSLKILIINPLD